MNKLFLALSLIVLSSVFAFAQDEYKKGEFFIGYSNGQVDTGIEGFTSADTGIPDRSTFHGFNAAGVYNFSRYVGLKGDVSGTYNNTRFSFPVTTGTTTQTVTFDTNNALYNVLGGIQVKDNLVDKKFKPFVHAMAGLGHGKVEVSNLTCTSTSMINCDQITGGSQNGFAMVFGGGLDIRLSDRIDLRAIQVDYNPIKFDENSTNNYRFGVGIVIK